MYIGASGTMKNDIDIVAQSIFVQFPFQTLSIVFRLSISCVLNLRLFMFITIDYQSPQGIKRIEKSIENDYYDFDDDDDDDVYICYEFHNRIQIVFLSFSQTNRLNFLTIWIPISNS
ncbi:hypothetical protein BLOT_010906 [Blomia tropicalis]|nr:hypothetical protein BLOT_010906 [Blomia tropicalis]